MPSRRDVCANCICGRDESPCLVRGKYSFASQIVDLVDEGLQNTDCLGLLSSTVEGHCLGDFRGEGVLYACIDRKAGHVGLQIGQLLRTAGAIVTTVREFADTS